MFSNMNQAEITLKIQAKTSTCQVDKGENDTHLIKAGQISQSGKRLKTGGSLCLIQYERQLE